LTKFLAHINIFVSLFDLFTLLFIPVFLWALLMFLAAAKQKFSVLILFFMG